MYAGLVNEVKFSLFISELLLLFLSLTFGAVFFQPLGYIS